MTRDQKEGVITKGGVITRGGAGNVRASRTMWESTPAPGSLPAIAASEVPTVTAAQMAEIDRLAVDEFGITLLQMMEQAGSHLAEAVRLDVGGDLERRAVVVAVGPGNNGGGGLAAARHLVNRGADVRVVLARPVLRLSEAGRHQMATLLAMETRCCVSTYDLADDELDGALARADVIVDALLGYRAAGPPSGEVGRLVARIARAGRPVVSLDLPSGLHPDTGRAAPPAIRARATLTLALPKPGLLRGPDAARAGHVLLADLGLPTALYRRAGVDVGSLFARGRIVSINT